MRDRVKVLLTITMVIFFVPDLIAFQLSGKEFPKKPERIETVLKESQLKAWDAFRNQNPKWNIRWGKNSQAPSSLVGPPLHITSGTPEQIAKAFLKSQYELFGMNFDLKDLELIKEEKRMAQHITFQQTFGDIPVEGGIYSVNMTNDGMVYYASGDYFGSISLNTLLPTISKVDAVEYAINDLGSSRGETFGSDTELVILPFGSEFRLVWKTAISVKNEIGHWVYFISANDGKVLTGYNNFDVFFSPSKAIANGDVYDHHPNAGPVVNRSLTHLGGTGSELDGSYIKVFNEDVAEINNGNFIYSPTNTHFDEVMVYYHATEFQKLMGNVVNYPYLNYPNSIIKVHANVHYGINYSNAGAGYGDSLIFGDGDGISTNSFAKEDVVIAHEYQHLITTALTYNGLNSGSWGYGNETDALDEAFSDYFAGNYAGTTEMGAYVFIAGALRNMDNTFVMSDWKGSGGTLSTAHEGSQIFSGALWNLRQELGASIANILIFEGLDNLNGANPKFIDSFDALIASDYAFYNGTHIIDIVDAFAAREIIQSFSGTITSNTTWSSRMYLTGNTIIDNNATLTVAPGTTVLLSENVMLQVKPGAKIIAEGTEQGPIRFIRADPDKKWNKILLSSSAGNSFKWVVFDGGDKNINIASRNNTLTHVTSRNGWRGISGWHNQDGSGNSQATISYALIEDNTSVGLVSHYMDLNLSHTTIRNNVQAGLYVLSNSVKPFHHNKITGNGGTWRDGIEVLSSGTLYMYGNGYGAGYNEIQNNGDDQISNYGDLFIGEMDVNGVMGGYNSIYGNYSGSRYLVDNNSGSMVYAEYVWWGQYPAASAMTDGRVQLDQNMLHSDPTIGQNPGAGGQVPAKIRAQHPTVQDMIITYNNAEQALGQAETTQQAIDEVYRLYQLAGLSGNRELKDRFNSLIKNIAQAQRTLYTSTNRNNEIQDYAKVLYAKSLIRDEQYGNVQKWLKQADFSGLTGKDQRDYLHVRMVTEAYHESYEAAFSTLDQLYAFEQTQGEDIKEFKARYSTFEEDLRARMNTRDGDGKTKEPLSSGQPANELSLQAYPNPFNPTTNITFTLPAKGKASLVVYDLLGREVATLVNKELTAGKQTFRFNASNLANGVYLYRLRIADQVITQKMTLIK